MKINNVNSINVYNVIQQKKLKDDVVMNDKCSTDVLNMLAISSASLSFKAMRRVPTKGLELQNENAVVLADNILKRLNKLKEKNIQGNFMKPFLIKGKDANYGLQLDNREPNCIRFTIRNFIEQPEDWGNKTNGQSVLEFSVDKDGKIVFGEFDKRESENYSKRYEFKKVSDKINRIKTNEGLTLQNSRQRDKFTTKVDLCKNKISREYDMYKDFAELDAGMSEIFFKLVQGRSLFV